ncbi:hypothetical protein Ancab_016783 [Ancistrocladus abbreviatus]
MATDVMDGNSSSSRVQKLFDHLEAKKSLLTTCTDVYKTLTSHFSSLEQSLAQKSQTLDSKIQALESESSKALELLQQRDDSLPERESSLSAQIEAQKQAALAEFENPAAQEAELFETLKSLCRKMDHSGLLKFVVSKRKESVALRAEIGNALLECLDPPRLVLDAVEEFVNQKAAKSSGGGGGLTDRRWACGMIVSGLFPPDELKEGRKKNVGPAFADSVVERALQVVEGWKGKVEESGEGLNGVGPAEAAMFLQLMVGFGFKDKFDEEFLKKVVLEFAARRDMAKLAVAVFGEKMGDVIDELVRNGKEIEAVYFASESGLTERFRPVSLLTTYLNISKRNVKNILKNGNHSASATDESNNMELNSIRAIIKCVEDHKLEAEFPIESLRKRLTQLEKAKAEKRKGSAGGSRPSNKRAHGSGGGRGGPPPPFRPSKAAKFSSPYPPFGRRNPPVPAHQSPVARYSGPYNYPSQSAYEGHHAAAPYGSTYGGPHVPASAPVPQQHYPLPVDNMGAGVARVGSSYAAQAGYASYDYGAASPTAYQSSTYTQ